MMQSAPIESLCVKVSSGGTPSRKRPEFYASGNSGHLWVKSKELLDGPIDDTEEKISDEGLKGSSAKYFPANTVLMAMYGANVGQLGWLKRPATVNQAVCGMVVNEEIADPRYVFYALLYTRTSLTAKAQGAAQQNLNQGLIKEFEIPTPCLEVQEKIAAILSAYDDLIENNTRRIKILEEMAQAIYREWFVKFRFPGHEKVKMIDSPLGPIPEGWEVVRLGNIAEEVRRGISKGALEEPTPYVGLEHIPRKSLALNDWDIVTELGSNKLVFEPGEVLFGKIRPYFHKVSIAPFRGICSADTIVIRSRDDKYTALVTACVSSEHFVAYATATANGAKMPRANWKVLVEYKVIKPTADLLGKFSEIFDVVIAEQKNLVLRNNVLRKTRDLLLPRLISGEIDVLEMEEDKRQRSRCVNG